MSPVVESRTSSLCRPAARWPRTTWPRWTSMKLRRTSWRSATTSVQDARPGLETGAAMSLKFLAPSLVRITKRSPWCSTEYSISSRRGSITCGVASGVSLAMNRTSPVTWLAVLMKTYRSLFEASTLTSKRSSRSSNTSTSELVAVENDLLVRLHGSAPPAVDLVVEPFHRARVVPPASVKRRGRGVGLLDAPDDLAVERVLERARAGHHRAGVRVLSLEVGDDLGVVLVPQPVVGVDPPVAVRLQDVRPPGRHRRTSRSDPHPAASRNALLISLFIFGEPASAGVRSGTKRESLP